MLHSHYLMLAAQIALLIVIAPLCSICISKLFRSKSVRSIFDKTWVWMAMSCMWLFTSHVLANLAQHNARDFLFTFASAWSDILIIAGVFAGSTVVIMLVPIAYTACIRPKRRDEEVRALLRQSEMAILIMAIGCCLYFALLSDFSMLQYWKSSVAKPTTLSVNEPPLTLFTLNDRESLCEVRRVSSSSVELLHRIPLDTLSKRILLRRTSANEQRLVARAGVYEGQRSFDAEVDPYPTASDQDAIIALNDSLREVIISGQVCVPWRAWQSEGTAPCPAWTPVERLHPRSGLQLRSNRGDSMLAGFHSIFYESDKEAPGRSRRQGSSGLEDMWRVTDVTAVSPCRFIACIGLEWIVAIDAEARTIQFLCHGRSPAVVVTSAAR